MASPLGFGSDDRVEILGWNSLGRRFVLSGDVNCFDGLLDRKSSLYPPVHHRVHGGNPYPERHEGYSKLAMRRQAISRVTTEVCVLR